MCALAGMSICDQRIVASVAFAIVKAFSRASGGIALRTLEIGSRLMEIREKGKLVEKSLKSACRQREKRLE